MKEFDKYLKNHIDINFNLMPFHRLDEKHGYNADIVEYVNDAISFLKTTGEFKKFKGCSANEASFMLTSDDIGVLPWFVDIVVNITWKRAKESTYSGGYLSNMSDFDEDGFFFPIRLEINGQTFMDALYCTKVALCHELLHAYEDYQRRINGKPSIMDASLTNGYYGAKALIGNKDNIKSVVADLIYRLTSFERNAYSSQLYSEIENGDQIFSREDVFNNIKKSHAYGDYKRLKNNVAALNLLTGENDRKSVIDAYNEAISKSQQLNPSLKLVSTYSQFLKVINSNWRKFDKKFRTNCDKMVFDILASFFGTINGRR